MNRKSPGRKIILWISLVLVISFGFLSLNFFTQEGLFNKISAQVKKIKGKKESFTPWVWKKITVRAVGDFIPHGSVLKAASDHKNYYDSLNYSGFRFLIEPVNHLFSTSQINIVNFETPCSPTQFIQSKSFVFNVPPDAIDALSHANFNVFNLANNHIYDQGRAGFIETIKQFEKRDLAFSGVATSKNKANKPLIYEIDDVKIAVWSFTYLVNDNYNHKDSSWVNVFELPGALKKIKQWKDSVDVTLVTFHGGDEYQTEPLRTHIQAFRSMLDSGATAVIGSHPHVPQPIEIYQTKDGRDGVIFYSLGNFIANQSRKYHHPISAIQYGDTRDAMVADFTLMLVDYGPLGKKWEISDVGIIPCWVRNNFKTFSKDEKRIIQALSVYDELDSIDVQLDNLFSKFNLKQAVKRDSIKVKELIKRKRHFLNRIQRIKKIVGDEFVKRP